MFELAVRTFSLLPAQSVMVGDKETDLEAASGAGVGTSFLLQPDLPDPFGAVMNYLQDPGVTQLALDSTNNDVPKRR
jgi:histidinol phosphatase-like enzyme